MTFDDGFGFSSSVSTQKKTKCKTFESSSPPEFKGNVATFIDNKTGARIELDKNRVEGFRRKNELYRIKVCGR
jgi:hypothetical protein